MRTSSKPLSPSDLSVLSPQVGAFLLPNRGSFCDFQARTSESSGQVHPILMTDTASEYINRLLYFQVFLTGTFGSKTTLICKKLHENIMKTWKKHLKAPNLEFAPKFSSLHRVQSDSLTGYETFCGTLPHCPPLRLLRPCDLIKSCCELLSKERFRWSSH